MFDVEEELKKLPAKPGVYIMHDADDTIIYVGKAVNLHNRVRSYFRKIVGRGPQIDKMVRQIERFEYIVTDSELEALVLENNLIKEHRPKYNTMLKDDKTYPYIKVTVAEEYPRILFSRVMKKDKSKYFGPYTSAAAVRDTIELMNKLFLLRSCNRNLPRDIGKDRPCLNYHIKQCAAPCAGCVSREDYRAHIDQALDFLNGNYAPILKDLKEHMERASEALDFEEAIRYRELLNSVKSVAQKQEITGSDGEDKDIIAMCMEHTDCVVQVFFVRGGKLIGLPIFAQGGGIGYIFQPSFGYIIGFAVGAYVTGAIAGKGSRPGYGRLLAANFAGLFIVYLFGMVYYYLISNLYLDNPIGLWPLFLYCFLLAVPGDILLCFLGAVLGKRLIPLIKEGKI